MQIPRNGVLFFDSGIGGLTVMRDSLSLLQDHTFYYYGDNVHAPYGNLSPEEITRLVCKAMDSVLYLQPKAAVIACNTATSVCISLLRARYPFPVVGIEPAIRLGGRMLSPTGGVVLVLATCATCASERVRIIMESVQSQFPNIKILLHGCENLAREIEEYIHDSSHDFAPFFPRCTPDVVVLGCTHYSFVKAQIAAFYGVPVLDGNEGVAKRLQTVLALEEKTPVLLQAQPLVTPSENSAFFPSIYFLGETKKHNKRIFEQMFANIRK